MAALAKVADSLEIYRAKRDFAKTPEPRGEHAGKGKRLAFVVQKHDATRLHYDFRLELDGVLLSWAVPKGPSLDPRDKRMAVRTEDHPLSYGSFEGTIPEGQYGAGRVIVWDNGAWEPIGDPRKGLAAGKLAFTLEGRKLSGQWELIRLRKPAERRETWLLFKKGDAQARRREDFDILVEKPDSVMRRVRRSSRRGPAVKATPAAGRREPTSWPAGAVKAPLPKTLAPQLATPASDVPDAGKWQYEVKFDGYRLLARIERGRARLVTRGGHDWTARLPSIRRAAEALKLGSGWLDGEIVVLGANGSPDFNALQKAVDDARTAAVTYFVFDIPFIDGYDLRGVPLQERRQLLERLLRRHAMEPLRFSTDLGADPDRVLEAACRMGLEGLIAKRVDAPYVSRRSDSWLKLKCRRRQEFVIAGFRNRGGERGAAEIGALLLGVHDERGQLVSVGSVGTGWSSTTARELMKRLSKLEVAQSPYADRAAASPGRSARAPTGHARWVKPKLVAEVRFSGWTPAGQLRHASFVALRADKSAAAVTREKDAPAGAASPRTRVASTDQRVNVSHPDRVIDPASCLTKLDLVRYYESVAEWILPHLRGRPCSLVRAPAGIAGKLFYQKHADGVSIPDVKSLDPALWPDHGALLEVATARALVGAAQMNTIELHTWNSTVGNVRRPDRVVFDLDPGDGVPWSRMQEGAELIRALLRELNLEAWLKTSGGKGLHVVVPISPRHDHAVVKQFSKDVVEHLARVIPDRFVAKSGPSNRVGRIFVDYLRNGEGATTVAAFSARARPGLGVSMPVGWEELPSVRSGAHWTIKNARDHLSLRTGDPWVKFATTRQSLAAALKQLTRVRTAAPYVRGGADR